MNAPLAHPLFLLESDVLRTFIAIAETGSFSAAANAVFRTPSAVSMQIKKMEEQLGKPLFDRDSRSVNLTPDGEILLGYARRMLAINREAVSHFVSPEISGIVTIGTPDDVGERILPSVLTQFAKSHPDIVVDVVMDFSVDLKKRFDTSKLDIMLQTCATNAVPEGAEILLNEPLVWGAKKGGCAHTRRPMPVSLWEEGCAWRSGAVEALEKFGIPYRVAYLSAHAAGQRAAILSDLAVAPLPKSSIFGDIRAVCPDDGLPEIGTYNVIMHVKPEPDDATLAAADHIRAAFEERKHQSAN